MKCSYILCKSKPWQTLCQVQKIIQWFRVYEKGGMEEFRERLLIKVNYTNVGHKSKTFELGT